MPGELRAGGSRAGNQWESGSRHLGLDDPALGGHSYKQLRTLTRTAETADTSPLTIARAYHESGATHHCTSAKLRHGILPLPGINKRLATAYGLESALARALWRAVPLRANLALLILVLTC